MSILPRLAGLAMTSLVVAGTSTAFAQPLPTDAPAAPPTDASPIEATAPAPIEATAPATATVVAAPAPAPQDVNPAAPNAASEPWAGPVGYRTRATQHRHDGFFLRVHLGPAWTSATTDLPEGELSISGTGGTFGITIGSALKDNVILHAKLFDDIAVGPTVENGGSTAETSDDTSAGVVGIGLGLTYYTPSNAFVSGTLAANRLTAHFAGDMDAVTNYGPGVELMAGKEWWVAPDWGIGVALQLVLATMDDSDAVNAPTWTSVSFGLGLTATYN